MNAFNFLIFAYLFKICFSKNEHVVYVKKCYIYLKNFRLSCLPFSSSVLLPGPRNGQRSLNPHLTNNPYLSIPGQALFYTPVVEVHKMGKAAPKELTLEWREALK